jgi:hypothetical protein
MAAGIDLGRDFIYQVVYIQSAMMIVTGTSNKPRQPGSDLVGVGLVACLADENARAKLLFFLPYVCS